MKLFKYFLIFVIPLIFLSFLGSFFTGFLPIKKNTFKNKVKKLEAKDTNIVKEAAINYIFTIVIDPSDSSLDFCFELAKKFRDSGINVYLTKNSNYEIGQEEKFEILYKVKASLYLHINLVKDENFKNSIVTLDNNLTETGIVNFIPNAIIKSKKTIFTESNIIDALSFYFSINKENVIKKYSEIIDVPIDIASIIFSFKYNKNNSSNTKDKILKSVIMGLSSKNKG